MVFNFLKGIYKITNQEEMDKIFKEFSNNEIKIIYKGKVDDKSYSFESKEILDLIKKYNIKHS